MRMIGISLKAAAAGLAIAAAVPAAAMVTYAFEGLSAFAGNNYGRFSITLPDYVSATSVFPASQFSSCEVLSNPQLSCGAHGFTFATVSTFGINSNMIEFAVTDGQSELNRTFFYFELGAFAADGVYDNIIFGSDQAGRLTVSSGGGGGGGGPVIPEPATWALLISGFGVVGAALRRQRGTATA